MMRSPSRSHVTFETDADYRRTSAHEERRWYACYTFGRHEKKVDSLLRRQGIESFLPKVSRRSQWHDRVKAVEWPLFPSYVFARVKPSEMIAVVATHGVVEVLGTAGRPVAVPDAEIENVRRCVQGIAEVGVELEPTLFPQPGQLARVSSGPFQGVTGIILERRGHKRLLVGLTTLKRGFEVEIDSTLLEPVGPEHGAG